MTLSRRLVLFGALALAGCSWVGGKSISRMSILSETDANLDAPLPSIW
ncbi:MAG: hypothetical protein WDN69_10555 [Aliidongia sp.]